MSAQFLKRSYGKGRKRRGVMNRLEGAYANHLDQEKREGRIEYWVFESVKFGIGAGAWFCPDFMIMRTDGQIEFHETKGFMREAANFRLKVAADKYPFRFVLIKLMKSGWIRKEI